MRIKDFALASRTAEAYSLMQEAGASAYLIAGGTSTSFVTSRKPRTAIDIGRVPIRGITRKGNVFRIGACTTIDEIMKYQGPGWVLNKVAMRFVNQQIRNISTIGGNISRVFWWSDFPVALRALEGTLHLYGPARREAAIAEAFRNGTAHKQAFNHVILEYVEVPRLSRGMGFGYSKETRTSEGFSAATVAAFVRCEKGRISEVRIAIGAVLPFPMRLFEVEESLKGQKAGKACTDTLHPGMFDKYRLSPREGMTLDYCKHLLKVRVSDVIREATADATGESND